jgi:hypothetical protein
MKTFFGLEVGTRERVVAFAYRMERDHWVKQALGRSVLTARDARAEYSTLADRAESRLRQAIGYDEGEP